MMLTISSVTISFIIVSVLYIAKLATKFKLDLKRAINEEASAFNRVDKHSLNKHLDNIFDKINSIGLPTQRVKIGNAKALEYLTGYFYGITSLYIDEKSIDNEDMSYVLLCRIFDSYIEKPWADFSKSRIIMIPYSKESRAFIHGTNSAYQDFMKIN
ncbi:hypothetical protein [Vibrio sp. D431a]|uniref:hypothetical protein n=1 Tax=Vibrio sp. D431a TaxID=2837388 RepID=UPI00255434D3|nr:hypothetical protein [Vibrio sp. D431a]MDK9790087.1 hypothetical protein [Vibrio sp. D431a]